VHGADARAQFCHHGRQRDTTAVMPPSDRGGRPACRGRNVQKLDRGVSGRLAIVEAQESAEALPAYDRSGPVEVGGRHDELAGQALMVSVLVVLDEVLADRGA